jgi:TnpA family transposase
LKHLSGYPKQNGLAKALREIGGIERTLFMLDWFRDPGLRRRVQAGLNQGEARIALLRERCLCTGRVKSGIVGWNIRATAPVG